jgi:hypothetical protein
MIEQQTPDCALGLTTDILSAWQDGDLRSEEMQRIREHTETCAACQQRLAGFVTVARALGRELEPGDRVWRGVQDRIASQTHGRSAPMRVPAWSWRGIAAVASVIIIVGLLAYVFSAVGAQRRGLAATNTPTVPAVTSTQTVATTPTLTSSTTVTGPQLSWQPVPYPSGATSFSTTVAPNDGDIAYTCVAPAQGETNAHTYVTRDRGRDWVRGADVPVGAQPTSTSKPFMLICSMVVDASHPDTVVIATEWLQAGASGDLSQISTFASFNYGAHWQKLVFAHPFAMRIAMASYAGSIYAFGTGQIPGGFQGLSQGLWVSHDQMRTWQPLALPANATVSAFWLNASTGALLVAANGEGSGDSLLFTSTDGGAHWTQLPAPSSAQMTWVVQAPQGNQPWQICGAAAPPPDRPQPQVSTLTCSSDSGQTWATRPALTLVVQNGPKGLFVVPTDVFALASDGAVLATVIDPTIHVYRLPAGNSVWQDLGPQPDPNSANPTYYPTPTGSVLWFSGASMVTATYPSASVGGP